MKKNNKISIIIPACNEEENISIMLESIKKQSYTNWECIVICNNCTDNTYDIAKQYENIESKFRVYNFADGGVSMARNKGIELSIGDFIVFFDADDYIDEDLLYQLMAVYEETNQPLIHGKMRAINTDDSISTWGCNIIGWIDINDNIIFSDIKNDFGHCLPFLYKKTLIENIRFNEDLSICEDLLFNMEIILKNKGVYNTDIIGYNYVRKNSVLSKNKPNEDIMSKTYSKIEKKYGKNNIFEDFLNNIYKNRCRNNINVNNVDKKHKFLYSKFSSYCINRIKLNSKIIYKKELQLGEILISPYLFFKSENIKKAFEFNDYDAIVFCETPIIDILDSYKIPDSSKPSYDTRLVGFNNNELLEWWKQGKTDEELYNHCKQQGYKVKVLFSNIMVDEKMKMFGVEWIPEEIRREHEIDIINFFNYENNDIKIDYIFPYVNYNDEEWYKEYSKCIKKESNINSSNNIVRYKDYGVLEYKIKSIYKNMSWINNIFIIISNESQLPSEFLQKFPNIKIVYHKDFIPEEFLPTFNSNTIEMFLGNIDELSEMFIYSNDDIIISSKTHVGDFFYDKKPIIQICKRNKNYKTMALSNIADNFIYNGLMLAKNDKYKGFIEDDNFMLTCNHADKPMLKSVYKKVYEKYKTEIHNSITQFRSIKNFNIYMYLFFFIFNGLSVNGQMLYKGIALTKKFFYELMTIDFNNYLNISLDFIEDIDDKDIAIFKQILQEKLQLE